jgi:hypothetical protein
MPGPTITLNNPLNVGGGGSGTGGATSAGGGGGGISGDLDTVSSQVRDQTQQFGSLVKVPSFTGQSEMGSMLKLQREISLEQLIFQTLSNVIKSRFDSAKNAISNTGR